MKVEDELRKRFATAINKFVQPNILFGPKWVRPLAGGAPGRYQFVGTPKVSKATGIPPHKVVKKILTHLKLGGLDLTARASPTGAITLIPDGTPAKKGKAGGKGEPGDKKKSARKAKKKP